MTVYTYNEVEEASVRKKKERKKKLKLFLYLMNISSCRGTEGRMAQLLISIVISIGLSDTQCLL
jgi:hypothetical protein